MKNKNKPEKKKVFSVLRILAPQVFMKCPVGFIGVAVISILHSLVLACETVLQQRVFDRATELAAGIALLEDVVISVLVFGAVCIGSQILTAMVNIVPEIFLDKIDGKLSYDIHRKIARLSPLYFEKSQTLDVISKAERGKGRAVMFVYMFWMIVTSYIPYFFFVGWYLFTLKPVLAISIMFVFLPVAAAQLIRTNVLAKLEDESVPIRRQYDYYESCIVDRKYFKETRQLGAFSFFRKMFAETLDLLLTLSFRAAARTNLIELAMRFLTVGGYFGIIYFLFDSLMTGDISLGAFAAVFNSTSKLYSHMEEIICGHIARLASNYGSICNYIDFLALPEEEKSGEKISETDIILENVGFSYPNAEKAALKNVSMVIKKSETLAIVGENGSGKSTLLKLICGLYSPTQGTITYGAEKGINRYTVYECTSAVFQDYQRYQMTLRDNVDISQKNRKAQDEVLKAIMESAGIKIERMSFSEALNTMLSREFGGVDLSGGQWQRIAIARGIYRTGWLIVLDEPTSSVDPCEESRIYEKFIQITRGRTALLITHRIGSARIADKIAVMKSGQLVEFGSHTELLSQNGEYSRLFRAQAKWYEG